MRNPRREPWAFTSGHFTIFIEKSHFSIRQSRHKRLHLFKNLQGKSMTKLIRNSTAEFLIFTNQAGD